MKKKVAILGSTGSIGTQALDVIAAFPDDLEVVALAAGSNAALLKEQVWRFRPKLAALADVAAARQLKEDIPPGVTVVDGDMGLMKAATLPEADIVLTALVGTAGLLPTLAAIEEGKDIALANKETLVAAGEIVMNKVRQHGVKLLPVDSEHSAIFQCCQSIKPKEISRIILTASGGPLRGRSREEVAAAKVAEVLRHPNWRMGKKITVDSATMMNKGLEVIEARWLFDLNLSQIEVVVHPQSIIHSLVETVDGSLLAQMGLPDMRLPIQYALLYPDRKAGAVPRVDLAALGRLTFEPPDMNAFPALQDAYWAADIGGTMPAVMNAANEVAVGLFLAEQLTFGGIHALVRDVMSRHQVVSHPDLAAVLEADRWARNKAWEIYRCSMKDIK